MKNHRISTGQRVAAGVLGATAFVIFLGCMSIGGKTEIVHRDERANTQNGKANVAAAHEVDVYYPAPFASTPNLDLESFNDSCVIVDQKPDHFRVRNTSNLARSLTWTAKGIPTGTNATPTATTSPPAPTVTLTTGSNQ